MNKIIVNIHPDFIETEDEIEIERYKKFATENLLAVGWDEVDFENVEATYSTRTQNFNWSEDKDIDPFETQDAIERAIVRALS